MVARLGMSEALGNVEYTRNYENLSSETKALIEAEVRKMLDASYNRARELLISKRHELDLLAKALVEYETLSKSEVEKVIRGEPLVDRIKVPPGPMTVPKPIESIAPGASSLPPLSGGRRGGDDGPRPAPPPAASAKEDGTA
jgi:ATP-dependent metalloprotease